MYIEMLTVLQRFDLQIFIMPGCCFITFKYLNIQFGFRGFDHRPRYSSRWNATERSEFRYRVEYDVKCLGHDT